MKKKPEPKKKPSSRPPIPIDWAVVDKFLEADCSGAQVAGLLAIHADTLYARCAKEKGMPFSEYANSKRAKGDSLLKAKQYDEALGGDRGMLIWLGKQRLGQKENHELNVTGTMNVGVVNYGTGTPKPWDGDPSEKKCGK